MAKVIIFSNSFYGFPLSKLQENGERGGKRRDNFATLGNSTSGPQQIIVWLKKVFIICNLVEIGVTILCEL